MFDYLPITSIYPKLYILKLAKHFLKIFSLRLWRLTLSLFVPAKIITLLPWVWKELLKIMKTQAIWGFLNF